MSTLAVTPERLVIHEHTNADALELAQVGEYRAVVGKGTYVTGDIALYIPEQAVLPDDLIEELGLTGRLAGSKHDRVKAVRLRGELSQGIVCRPAALTDIDWDAALAAGTDFAELLGITKWVPDVPTNLAGAVAPAPDFLPWIEIENIKRYPDLFTPGEEVEATEKIHGSSLGVSWFADGRLLASSKGLGQKRLAIVESDSNSYWMAIRDAALDKVCEVLGSALGAEAIGLFGEVYGSGIQDLAYGRDRKGPPAFACFDAYAVGDREPGVGRWLERDELEELVEPICPLVPVLYRGPYDFDILDALATGPETVTGDETHLREGVVVRAVPERRSSVTGGRAIGKLVSAAYLTRKGGTEFE
jgi:RNA ligase (TIGR02306 family)